MKKIAVIGSSGGNLYYLGGKDPDSLLAELLLQFDAAGMECASLQFIAAKASMDSGKEDTHAELYAWDENGNIKEGAVELTEADREVFDYFVASLKAK